MMLNKDHLSLTGFLTILTYYASINRGISKNVLKYYANIIPHGKLEVSLPDSLNPDWVSGFVAGDGGFAIYVKPAKDYTLAEKVYVRFHIAQHSKDIGRIELRVIYLTLEGVNICRIPSGNVKKWYNFRS